MRARVNNSREKERERERGKERDHDFLALQSLLLGPTVLTTRGSSLRVVWTAVLRFTGGESLGLNPETYNTLTSLQLG